MLKKELASHFKIAWDVPAPHTRQKYGDPTYSCRWRRASSPCFGLSHLANTPGIISGLLVRYVRCVGARARESTWCRTNSTIFLPHPLQLCQNQGWEKSQAATISGPCGFYAKHINNDVRCGARPPLLLPTPSTQRMKLESRKTR